MPSIGFRSNRPARLEKRAHAKYDEHEDMNLKSPNRQSIQQLTHQQLVTRQRQLLLRQNSDHTAETKDGSHSLNRTASSPYLHKTLDPKASSASVNTIVNTIESRIERVDVERAIELLQELKKNATAEELVALHRALLPVKEDKPSQAPQLPPIDELAYTSIPQDRTRSSIPPGLATRSGSYTDPLRKPPDPTVTKSGSGDCKDSWFPDFDKRRSRPASPERLSTPPEQSSYHAGAYQTGTLRITNGAASPEPSIISKLAMEVEEHEDQTKSEVLPPKKDQSPLRKRITMAVLNPRKAPDEADPSSWQKRMTMAARPEENNQSKVAPPVLPKLDFARSRDDLDIISPRSSMMSPNSKSIRSYLLPTLTSPDFTKDLEAPQVIEPRAQSFDFGAGARCSIRKELQLDIPLQRRSIQHNPKEIPEDVPRFQQRWDHRAAHLSNENTNGCEITRGPHEDKRGLLDFATRLSTVCDQDEEEDEGVPGVRNSHAETLNKLTGGSDLGPCEQEVGVARSSYEVDAINESPCARLGTVIRKVDSGYCSDVSQKPLPLPLPHISTCQPGRAAVSVPLATTQSQEPTLPSVEPAACTGATADASTPQSSEPLAEIDSLPTFDKMVGSGPQSEATISPSPQEVTKRSPLSLFRSRATRSKSFTVLNVHKGPASPEDISRSSTFQSSDDSRPPLNHKKSKKLQKAMPEAVRHQRKKTLGNIKASQVVQTELSDASNEQSDPDGFIGCQPKEESAEQCAEITSLFSRKRGKSFGRKRSKTATDTSKEVSPLPWGATTPIPSGSDSHRRRSKSIASVPVVSAPPKQPSADDIAVKQPQTDDLNTTPRRDLPVSTNSVFASVARALTSHPPDASADISRSAAATRRQHRRYYSMHRASSDGASITGVGPVPRVPNSQDIAEDPKTQDPKSQDPAVPEMPSNQNEAATASSPVAVGSGASVEDRFPEWEGKPATNITSQSPSYLQPPYTPRSRDNDVPALPELPADIAAKVAKADEMMAKKLKVSPRASPIGSARSSLDHNDGKKLNSAKKRTSPKDQRANEARQAALDKLTASFDRKFDEQKADLSVKGLTLKKPSGHVARWSIDGSIKLPHPEEQPTPASPTHDSKHPGWPGWEKQSSLWRERREAMAEPVTFEQNMSELAQTVPAFDADSTSIVVSRHITPSAAEDVHNAGNGPRGEESPTNDFAEEYSDLIVSDQENTPPKPDTRRADSAYANMTSATFITPQPFYDDRPAKMDILRSNTAFSTSSCATTTTNVSTASWAGSTKSTATTTSSVSPQLRHERTKSSHFKAFRLTDAAQAERSRALSVARRSAYLSSSESLGHLRNESLGLPKSRSDLPSLKNSSSESVLDRYSGGLGHGAFGGSAGTRSSEENRNGKCGMGEQFGLDLSDLPMFLRKV